MPSLRPFRLPAALLSLFSALMLSANAALAETRTVDGSYGPVTVEGVPKRVVALGDNALDAALSLDAHPLGTLASRGGDDVPDYLKAKAGDITLVGTVREPNLEAVLGLQPDLILASSELPRALYDKLSLIAPTIVPKGGAFQDWRQTLRVYAQALGQTERAEQRIGEIDERIAGLRKRLPTGQQVSVVRWNPQGPFIMSSQLFVGQLLDALGLEPNALATQTKRPHTDILSLENLNKADGDWIFLATLNPDGAKALAEARQQPAFKRLQAVQNDHVVSVDGQIWSSSAGYLAAQHILDDVEQALAN